MSLQMHDAKLALKPCDLGYHSSELFSVDSLACEELIQLSFFGYQGSSKARRLAVHSIINLLSLRLLLIRELQLRRELKHVLRARILIELGGFGESHPLPRLQRLNVLRRERLDLALLLSGVRPMFVLRVRRRGNPDYSQS